MPTTRLSVVALLLLAPLAQASMPLSMSVATLTIGNGLSNNEGTYINAQDLADLLAFTFADVGANSSITVAEAINLSGSIFGPTFADIALNSATVTIDGTVTMGSGNLQLNGVTVNLNDILVASDGVTLLDNTRLTAGFGPLPATTVNVNGNGSAVQAAWLASLAPGPVDLNLLGGDNGDESLLGLAPTVHVSLFGGILDSITLGNNVFDWYGGQLLGANGPGIFGFGGIANLYGSNFQLGVNTGFCNSLPEAQWSAAPSQVTNASNCVRGTFADGSSFVSNFQTNGTVNFVDVPVVPIPAAAWLFGGALAGLGFVRRRAS